jgi:uncharacterized protein (DUF362 family)
LPAIVSISRCDDYEREQVGRAIRSALEPLGGIGQFVRVGQRVLLKPNFVLARRAEEAANTHPHFVIEVARLVREAGGEPFVGDSPALGSARHVASRCGLLALAQEADVPIVEFRTTRIVQSPRGRQGRALRLAGEALDADVVINLPKLKAHGQMYLTLAIKNLFGCVRGRRKALFHQQLGGRPVEFARMLVDVCRVVHPALTLMDGIVALERKGPTGGDPRELGLVLAGSDCTAIERVACEIVGANPEKLLTLTAAREVGLGENDLSQIQVVDDSKAVKTPVSRLVLSFSTQPFVLPERLSGLSFSPWRIVRGLVRQAWAYLKPARQPTGTTEN